ncbi:glycosyl hydrolase [Celeribacter persicus]|uniref:Putative glycosyl hydrolase n=1 Tax=Celeribacter persicus TaxID=1651082 RepID=A0A2T5HMB6_9RHOB|nr:glycosyl hydrolase [Celeribacter persicus]PTQ72696.1 putative glycosyl hydrolase [Celeribacter persicus]
MVRQLLLAVLMLMPTALFADKAGIGAWENSSNTMLRWIEDAPALDWYYTWRPTQMWSEDKRRRSVEFVPMIRDAADVNKRIVSDLPVRTLLGFNEPDSRKSEGSNLSVEQAIALWPKLEARGLRLGSPAVTQGQTLGKNSWQGRFMAEVETRGLHVDFMAVHYYSSNGDVKAFENWLRAVHAEYKRPIWVTEFAYVDWQNVRGVSYAQNAAFAEAAILMMERLPFVERHAWFAANPYHYGGAQPQINLVSNTLQPTPVGVAFDRTLSRISARRVASNDE